MISNRVLGEVAGERARQDAKWGEQNHPNGTGDQVYMPKMAADPLHRVSFGTLAYAARRWTDAEAIYGRVTYAQILLEEVGEALAEDSEARLRAELIQVAAVAVAWVEKLDRRPAMGGTSGSV